MFFFSTFSRVTKIVNRHIRLLLITNNVASYVGDSVERREFRFMVLANIVKSSQKLHKFCTHDELVAGNFNRYGSNVCMLYNILVDGSFIVFIIKW